MWELKNETPYQAERGFTRDQNGSEVWIVAVKGTWDILADGSLQLSKEQVPIFSTAQYIGEENLSSLLYDEDLVLTKPLIDVILNGTAYAPQGEDTEEFTCSLEFGPLSKSIKVIGHRIYQKKKLGGSFSPPERITKLPLIYENSYGGKEYFENPIGVGHDPKKKKIEGDLHPNLFSVSTFFTEKKEIGFGAIPMDWPPRMNYAGTYDQEWQQTRQPLLPLDFDERFFQCAPTDQQLSRPLPRNAKVRLTNLTPNGYLEFSLPRVHLSFLTDLAGKEIQHHSSLHTVVIEPDHPRVILVWHTALPCQNQEQFLKQTQIIGKPLVSLGEKVEGNQMDHE